MDQSLIKDLKILKQKALFWSPMCDGYPSKKDCNQGDMVLFNGLLYFSGYKNAGAYIKNSISEDGRPTRSPKLANQEPQMDGFSKDMLLGILLYTLKSNDPEPLQKVIKYVKKTGSLCPLCSDNRCSITPTIAYLANQVAKHVRIKERLFTYINGPIFKLLEWGAALTSPKGYRLHLVAVKALIRKHLGESCVNTVKALNDKDVNPFFEYLDENYERSAKLLLERVSGNGNADKNQWSWERDDNERAYDSSMGWDIVFMCNLLIND